jgi:hypothetical protein
MVGSGLGGQLAGCCLCFDQVDESSHQALAMSPHITLAFAPSLLATDATQDDPLRTSNSPGLRLVCAPPANNYPPPLYP